MGYLGKNWLIGGSAAVAIAVLFSLIAPGTPPVSAAGPDAPGRVAGKPDFNGIWEANNTANWDVQTHAARPMVAQPGLLPNSAVLAAPVVALGSLGWVPPGPGIVEGDEIPYKPWAAQRKKENLEHWIDRDPEIKCFQAGIPRAIYMPHPFQMVQSDKKLQQVFEYANSQRTIHLNKMEEYPNTAWMGYSVGHWEGDTLAVDAAGFNDKTWLDAVGHPHSEALRIQERFYRRDFGHMDSSVTIDDPKMYTRPFTVKVTEVLVPDSDVLESICNENEKDQAHLAKK